MRREGDLVTDTMEVFPLLASLLHQAENYVPLSIFGKKIYCGTATLIPFRIVYAASVLQWQS